MISIAQSQSDIVKLYLVVPLKITSVEILIRRRNYWSDCTNKVRAREFRAKIIKSNFGNIRVIRFANIALNLFIITSSLKELKLFESFTCSFVCILENYFFMNYLCRCVFWLCLCCEPAEKSEQRKNFCFNNEFSTRFKFIYYFFLFLSLFCLSLLDIQVSLHKLRQR